MTKKIVHRERIENQFGVGEYHKWECGCSDIIFSDHGPSFSRKICGNEHEKVDMTDKRNRPDPSVSNTYQQFSRANQ